MYGVKCGKSMLLLVKQQGCDQTQKVYKIKQIKLVNSFFFACFAWNEEKKKRKINRK